MVNLRKDGLSNGISQVVPDKDVLPVKGKKPFIEPDVEVVMLGSIASDVVTMSPGVDWGDSDWF